mgnify:CR=1 FL=1
MKTIRNDRPNQANQNKNAHKMDQDILPDGYRLFRITPEGTNHHRDSSRMKE